ncbi:hypothetical protein SAMN05428974_0574 [Sphingopyxis sp. YR583]|uniref:transcriptional regulator domain-containing protein n=1 Tax=Sphingopyxis sp. YR583 TaxID=1881047 RepID=UPI0008A73E4A|nr:DUF6499 domain-containing protein [Sphingopyxis sp. YR583]SEH12833.1 hypothetical protein SAMN05428974_0574 [Sphingopyxis sp. YR583]
MAKIELTPALPPGSWREAGAYAGLEACGRRGLAWELLRRTPGYAEAAACEPGAARVSEPVLPAARAEFTARWGLHFR